MYSMLPYVTGIRYHATFSNSFLFVFLLLFVFCFCVCVFCVFFFVFFFVFFLGGGLLVSWLVGFGDICERFWHYDQSGIEK